MTLVQELVHDDLRLARRQHGLDVHAVLRLARLVGRDLGRLARTRRPAQSGRRRGILLVRRSRARRIGVYIHQLWLMWLGSGVIGGIGLGLGYISPVSTLVKWFPDRRGMATGMAIMGFGGGAMIGAPLADMLMNYFKTPTSVGVWQTFLAMGAIYFFFMMVGAFRYRLPPAGWRPEGWTPPSETKTMITQHQVHLQDAHKTPQFWLIWWVLCLNVSAGIGVIGMASPMLQEIFGGKLIGHPELGFNALSGDQKAAIAAIAAGFAGLLSLFNIGGRFFWASLSDYIGRKNTYYTFFLLGIALYALGAALRADRQQGAVRGRLLHHPVDVRRRLRHRAGLSRRHVRHAVRRRHSRPAADGLVDRRHHRAGGRELYPRGAARRRRAARPPLRLHHVHPVRHADHRLDLQLPGQAGEPEVVHERRRGREAPGGQRQKRGRRTVGLVRHRQRRFRLAKPRCSGHSSAYRLPGACGSRSNPRRRCFNNGETCDTCGGFGRHGAVAVSPLFWKSRMGSFSLVGRRKEAP